MTPHFKNNRLNKFAIRFKVSVGIIQHQVKFQHNWSNHSWCKIDYASKKAKLWLGGKQCVSEHISIKYISSSAVLNHIQEYCCHYKTR